MNDTTRLINVLRLERDTSEVPAGNFGRKLVGTLIVAAVLLAGRFIYWTVAGTPQGIPIQVVTVAPYAQDSMNPDNAVLNASGYIVARRQATVSAKITARVTEVFIDEGQRVEQGEVIATLDNTNIKAVYQHNQAQLEQASASLRAAQVAFDNEQPLFARVQQQLERGVGSRQDFDVGKARYEIARANLDVAAQILAVAKASLLVAERNLDDTIVRAPFSGIVTVKAAQPGEMVSPISAGGGFTRTGIGTIVDMASLEVDVDVSESFINRITANQPVTVRLNAYPDWAIAARVITVVPTADRAKATVKVRIALEQSDARILPDMGARVSFLRSDSPTEPTAAQIIGVVVPQAAVIANGGQGTVFVVRDTTVETREVTLGTATATGWLVSEGLEPGTRLAASALDELYDGAQIRIEQ